MDQAPNAPGAAAPAADDDEPPVPRIGPASGRPARQLVVLCHGKGGSGQQQVMRAERLSRALPNAVIACPNALYMVASEPAYRQWVPATTPGAPPLPLAFAYAVTVLDGFIDAELARLGLPATAYALMGFSQGASMVLASGLNRPTPPRAVLAFSGPLAVAEGEAPRITQRPPTLISHGELDRIVPIEHSRRAAELLVAAGVAVETLWLPEVDHTINRDGLHAAVDFLRRAFRAA